MSQEKCLRLDDLRRLLRGELAETEAEPLERHFATCLLCGERAAALEAEEPPSPVRELDWPNGEAIDRLMSRLEELSLPPAPNDTSAGTAPKEDTSPPRIGSDRSTRRKPDPGRSGDETDLPEVAGYELLAEVARGGMGIVYKAKHLALNRVVALKMILAAEYAGPQELARFQAEAEAAARLRHPNIVQVYEVGHAGGRPFLSLEFCPGGSLADLLREGPLPSESAVRLLEQLALAVESAHREQVIHRDLKPANILLTFSRDAESSERSAQAPALRSEDSASRLNGVTPKITDFGLAKRLDVGDGQTHTGDLLGTPSYMAPEQAEGRLKDVGPATDVYALGVILYEMLTGRTPFKGASIRETLELACQAEPVPPRALQPRVPRDLETICLKCLRKEPGKRYGSAAALVADCAAFIQGKPIAARPIGQMERVLKWVKRRPAQAVLGAVSILAIAALLALGFWVSAVIGAAHGELDAETARTAAAHSALQTEEARSAAHRQLAETHEFFGLQRRVEKRSASPEPGWTWDNLADLESAARLAPAVEHLAELRSEAATALGSLDLRLDRSVVAAGCVAFQPGGRLLALGQAKVLSPLSGEVRLIDLDRPAAERSLSFPARRVASAVMHDGVCRLAFSPDGRWLVAGTRSGMLHFWDLKGQAPAILSWPVETTSVDHLCFSADGDVLFSASDNGTRVHRWLVPTEAKRAPSTKPLQSYTATGNIRGLAMHPSGDWLACAVDTPTSRVQFLSIQTLQLLRPPLRTVWAPRIAFSPAGDLILAGGGQLKFPNRLFLSTGVVVRDSIGDLLIDQLAVSPNGVLIASSCPAPRQVQLWEYVAGRLLAAVPVGEGSLHLAFSPDGQRLAVTVESETRLYKLAGRGAQTFAALGAEPIITCALHPDGRSLASLSNQDLGRFEVAVWPLDRGQKAQPVMRHAEQDDVSEIKLFASLAFHPGSQVLAYRSPSNVIVRDSLGLTRPLKVTVPTSTAVAFASDGRLWGASEDELRVWDASRGQQLAGWKNRGGVVHTGKSALRAVCAGKRWAAVGARNGQVHLFSVADGARQTGITVFQAGARSVALRNDEAMLAAGSDSGEVATITLPGQAVKLYKGHRDEVRAVSWSGQGLLASGSRDCTVKLWREYNGSLTELMTLRQPGRVRWLAFHPDGTRLFVLLEDERAVRVWHLDLLWQRLIALGLGSGLEVIEARSLPKQAPAPAAIPPVSEPPTGPNGLRAELFADTELRRCVKVRYDSQIDFNWGMGAPDPLMPSDFFSVRWTGWLKAPRPGRYTLCLKADDSARLWLDGRLLVHCWPGDSRDPHAVEVDLSDAPHALRVEYMEVWKLAFVHLKWAQAGGFAMQPVPAACLFHDRATAQRAGPLVAPQLKAELVRTLSGHAALAQSVVFLSNGKQLVTGGDDATLLCWDLGTGKQTASFRVPNTSQVQLLTLAADGNQVLAACDNVVTLWDPGAGKDVRRFTGDILPLRELALHPGGRLMASANWAWQPKPRTIRVRDVSTGKTIWEHTQDVSVHGLVWTKSGKRLVTADCNAGFKEWDLETNKPVWEHRLPSHPPIFQVTSALDGSRIWVAVARHTPGRLDLYTLQGERLTLRWSVPCGNTTGRPRFSTDGRLVAVMEFHQGTIFFHDLQTGLEVGRISSPIWQLNDFALSPDGAFVAVATANREKQVLIWKLTKSRTVK